MQGPCHKGDLLIINPATAEPYCGCDSSLLSQYFYKPMKLCYEHFTKGPCELGSVFTYNHTSDTTDCECQQTFQNYFKPLGQCFELLVFIVTTCKISYTRRGNSKKFLALFKPNFRKRCSANHVAS